MPLASWIVLNSVLSLIFAFTYWIPNTHQQKFSSISKGHITKSLDEKNSSTHGVLKSEMPASIDM